MYFKGNPKLKPTILQQLRKGVYRMTAADIKFVTHPNPKPW